MSFAITDESTKSLVHPVDVSFDSKLGVYKMRTPGQARRKALKTGSAN